MSQLTPAQATLLASLISGLTAVGVCLINAWIQQKKMSAEFQKQEAERNKAEAVRDAKLEMWMKAVEGKLDIHNGYAEKLGNIEKSIAVIQNDIKTLYKQA